MSKEEKIDQELLDMLARKRAIKINRGTGKDPKKGRRWGDTDPTRQQSYRSACNYVRSPESIESISKSLERLADLKDRGTITEVEFQDLKNRLLKK